MLPLITEASVAPRIKRSENFATQYPDFSLIDFSEPETIPSAPKLAKLTK